MSTLKYAIGIDLGTTHCALASLIVAEASAVDSEQRGATKEQSRAPEPFAITQVLAAGETSARALLPSFLYLAAQGEFEEGALALPWSTEPTHQSEAAQQLEPAHQVVGEFARSKGATTPDRLVSSAKSWLSHAGVDRKASILPWGAPDDVAKLSPVQASAAYLAHLRKAWDWAHPHAPLVDQNVVLTIPASFDAVARELTLEAATLAGFGPALRLLEEPQAALYDWVAQSHGEWRKQVELGDRIVVIDIGGGTTDFSLISVSDRDGSLALERVAVGNHILLGGDNMDLALAYTVRAQLESEGKKLDDWQMVALTHACRAAKETLLSESPPQACSLVIPGRSSRLIGGSIRAELSLEQLSSVLLDGFFPEVQADARPLLKRRSGLSTIGLPYASDAAITRHLAAFLQGQDFPTAVLFNGGVTRSPVIRERLIDVLGVWANSSAVSTPRTLVGTDAELAVSRGAAYYAQAAEQGGLRIRSGTAQSHYIGIERAELAVPGIPPKVDAVCVAPFGMEEGATADLQQSFGLVLGEPVSFQFFASTSRTTDQVGTVVDPSELTELAPLETVLDGTDGEIAFVRLQARVTEVGTLEIAAVDVTNERRFKLSFNIRVE